MNAPDSKPYTTSTRRTQSQLFKVMPSTQAKTSRMMVVNVNT